MVKALSTIKSKLEILTHIIYKIYKTDFINITSFRGNNNLNIKIYSEAVSVSANKDRIVTQHIIKHTTHTSIYSPTLK